MRTTITLDDDLAATLKARAHAEHRSFKAVLNEVLRRGLAEVPATGRPTFTVEVHQARFLPGVDVEHLSALNDELEVEDFLTEASAR